VPGFLTRGVLVGDIRITIRDPTANEPDSEIEGVQKVHRVGDNIAIGFAGNIDTGFRMVGDIAEALKRSIPEGMALTQPSRYLLRWRRRARWAWRHELSDRDRAGGCSLLWIGALPPDHVGFSATVGWVLHSPEFEPEHIPSRTARAIA